MKFKKLWILPVLLIAFTMSYAEARSFKMECRAGGQVKIFAKNQSYITLHYIFKSSDGPASAGLEPGECAWLDRPVSPNEPHLIYISLRSMMQEADDVRLELTLKNDKQFADFTVKGTGPDYLKEYIKRIIDPTQTFFIDVYNSNGRYFMATKLGL